LLLFDKESMIKVVPPFYKNTSASSVCFVRWITEEVNPKSEIFCLLASLFLNWRSYSKNVFWSLLCVYFGNYPNKVQVILAADS